MIHPRWVLAMSVDDAMDKYEINNGTTAKLDRRATKAHYLGELLCK